MTQTPIAPAQTWEVRWTDRGCWVVVLVLATRASTAWCVTLDSSHPGTWPSLEQLEWGFEHFIDAARLG